MSAVEALYIFDEHNNLILNHVYTGRPPAPSTLLPLYLQHPAPRPSLTYLSSTNPPSLLYSIIQDNLLFLSPNSSDVEPLLILEFLHRVADSLEEFLGSPLLATKITANYDIVAQILAEMADGGIVCQGEANALRDVVETGPGVLNNLLGKVGIQGSAPTLGPGSSSTPAFARPSLQPALSSQGSAIPWRRANVRHTSNELYVDIVESLAVTMAPSGRPLSAFAHGSIAFTSKVSGVPDLLLSLSTGGKGAGMGGRGEQLRSVMERVVFHPCVRLSKWKSEGIISFVPPDGRFALCGYEVDLLGADAPLTTLRAGSGNKLDLPANIEVTTGTGPASSDFEVRLSTSLRGGGAAASSLQANLGPRSAPKPFRSAPSSESKGPNIENLSVKVPIPSGVRNIIDLRPSKGEAHWSPADGALEWRVQSKDLGPGGAVLRCTVQGPVSDADEEERNGIMNGINTTTYDYDDDAPSTYQQNTPAKTVKANGATVGGGKTEKNSDFMPTSATLSFSVKGFLASGLKVESLLVDTKKSKGLGAEVKPYKGVKYLTVSRDGIEVRC